jgi:hypothetical protein
MTSISSWHRPRSLWVLIAVKSTYQPLTPWLFDVENIQVAFIFRESWPRKGAAGIQKTKVCRLGEYDWAGTCRAQQWTAAWLSTWSKFYQLKSLIFERSKIAVGSIPQIRDWTITLQTSLNKVHDVINCQPWELLPFTSWVGPIISSTLIVSDCFKSVASKTTVRNILRLVNLTLY